MIVQVVIFIVTAILFSIFFHRKPKGLPPGEWGLPVVGYLPFLERKITKTLRKLYHKHGDIFSIKVGARTFIYVADYALIKTLFTNPVSAGRSHFFTFKLFKNFNDIGILSSDGHVWSTNRRFAIRTLKDFGLGKSSKMEEIIRKEAHVLVENLKKEVDKPTEIGFSLNIAVLNVIWRLVANRRYDINDEEILEFARTLAYNIKALDGPMVYFNMFPWLIPLLPSFVIEALTKTTVFKENRDKLAGFLKKIIQEHKRTLDPSDPKDYIDDYLIEMEAQKDNPKIEHLGDDDLYTTIFDLFLAGTDTTSNTLRWFFLYMAKYPEVQKRLQDQIDSVVPRDRIPSLEDKSRLPYLEALMHEINRIVTLLPTSTVHAATHDTEINGYTIPMGAMLFPCVEICHNSLKYWERPHELHIEHFLDSEGHFVAKSEGYLPFGVGRRQCVGETLAKSELFLFMGSILQNFNLFEPDGQSLCLEPLEHVNVINLPQEYEVLLRLRK